MNVSHWFDTARFDWVAAMSARRTAHFWNAACSHAADLMDSIEDRVSVTVAVSPVMAASVCFCLITREDSTRRQTNAVSRATAMVATNMLVSRAQSARANATALITLTAARGMIWPPWTAITCRAFILAMISPGERAANSSGRMRRTCQTNEVCPSPDIRK